MRNLPTPEQYSSADAYELLDAAAAGYLPVDGRLMHALVDEPSRTLDGILRFANEERGEANVDVEFDLVCLFAYLSTAAALPFLMRQVKEQGDDVASELAEAIVAIGAPAIEPLLALGEESGDPGEPEFLLASLGVRDQRILDRFLKLLMEDPGEAAFLLGVYGDAAARPAMEAALAEHPEEEDAIRAAISSLTDSPVSRGADEPFRLFDQYPDSDEPDWSILAESERIEFLRSGPPIHKLWAAQSFIEHDYSEDAMEALLAAAGSAAETDVRSACWEALGGAVQENRVSKPMLARLRKGDELPLLEQASLAAALAPQHGNDSMVRAAIERAYASRETRSLALEAMWPTLDTGYAKFFEQHLDDDDPAIRRQAIVGSGYLRIASAAPRLEPLLLDYDWREDALFGYALTAPGTNDKPGIRRMLEHVRETADGLNEHEEQIVKQALDTRLMLSGKPALFYRDEETEEQPPPAESTKVGRNDPCPCGSGKKYKKCCGA